MYEGLYIPEHSVKSVGHFVYQSAHVSLSGRLPQWAAGWAFEYTICAESMSSLSSFESHLTILFRKAPAFRPETENCTVMQIDKYALCGMGR